MGAEKWEQRPSITVELETAALLDSFQKETVKQTGQTFAGVVTTLSSGPSSSRSYVLR